jgi:starvation-inducible outer membrane lipoprotein
MRRICYSLIPLAAFVALACTSEPGKAQNESARAVSGGGITVNGWTGQIDPSESRRGGVISQAKLANDGSALHVTTGPAVAYWNPANTASGDYTVKATFTEPST